MKLLIILSLLFGITLASCKNDGEAARNAATESAGAASTNDAANMPVPTPPATPATEPAQNAAGVWHYICPKGCEGGAGSAIACPKCGTTLVHNQAYHNNANQPKVDLTNAPGLTPVPKPEFPATNEPAQNAAGVWHYTCPNGCEGGAGSAIACAKCGKTLVHNSAYHQ